jgi:flagellar L-ring protein precursor FlgH
MKPAALLAVAMALLAAGCKTDTRPFAGSPKLSLVGEGLAVQHAPMPTSFAQPDSRTFLSLYSANNQDLFRDLRARKVGDVVTVTIDINDKAQFDNASGRSKEAGAKGSFAAKIGLGGFGLGSASADASGNADASASAQSKGEGSIDRSEKLRLSIAAVVTEVLPEGNLFISGSQEVRVNREVRVLNIAGIVRTLDIASNNIISYEKIAEARVSYGGRGKLSDVQ